MCGVHGQNILLFFFVPDHWAWLDKRLIFCSFGEMEAIINFLTHMYILTQTIPSIASHFAPLVPISFRGMVTSLLR